MTPREYLVVTLTVTLGIFVTDTNARSWDLAILIGRDVQFFARNRTLTGEAKIAEAVSLAGVAYDDVTHTIYFSDTRGNVSIFSNDLTSKNFTSKPLFKRQSKSYIQGLAFDAKTRTLFWSDVLRRAIMKMHVPLNGAPEMPSLLHDLKDLTPGGIALDICNSHIYWVISNNTNSSVERSNLDGSDRTTVIKENLYEPVAVAIDHAEEKLYWIDDVEGIRMRIERSDLDGVDREVLVNAKHQQPVYLAVDRDAIYWSDLTSRSVWTVAKNASRNNVPVEFKSYYTSNQDADPAGIIARDNIGTVDCAAIAKLRQKTNFANSTYTPKIESFNNLTTSTEESELTTESSNYCLNDGHLNATDNSCRCQLGFTGAQCETNLCHNYCFQGSCNINSHGLPTCKCMDGFVGPRCETDPCKDYCLHDGQCSVRDEKPICECKYSEGSRCEILSNGTKVCKFFCASAEPVPTSILSAINCGCDDANETTAQMIMINENDEYGPLLPILGVFTAVLLLVIIVLSYYINKLRRRPRIRKRFVVSKGGVTPLTSRPQLPDNQCEITIENCCNMNICETPCFEPKLRTATPGNNTSKKEEKNSLLDNMEGNSW